MQVTYLTDSRGKRLLQIDNARITYRNFEGRPDQFTREGDRSFSLIIPNQELANELLDDKNEFGVGWNVKIRPPREEGDEPFMHMKVKLKFSGRGPNIYLVNGNTKRLIDEESARILDEIDIDYVNLDVRPYDDEGRFGPFRSAWLQNMEVHMRPNRFAD